VISGPRQFLASGHNRLDQRRPNQPQYLRLTGLPSWTGELITEVLLGMANLTSSRVDSRRTRAEATRLSGDVSGWRTGRTSCVCHS
jgi:hypothetical protein